MIRKEMDIQHKFVEHLKGGNGTVEIISSIQSDDHDSHLNLLARLILKPGCSLGQHRHDGEEEIVTILSGTALYNDNGSPIVLKAGDVCICRNGQEHGIGNASPTEDLEIFACVNEL